MRRHHGDGAERARGAEEPDGGAHERHARRGEEAAPAEQGRGGRQQAEVAQAHRLDENAAGGVGNHARDGHCREKLRDLRGVELPLRDCVHLHCIAHEERCKQQGRKQHQQLHPPVVLEQPCPRKGIEARDFEDCSRLTWQRFGHGQRGQTHAGEQDHRSRDVALTHGRRQQHRQSNAKSEAAVHNGEEKARRSGQFGRRHPVVVSEHRPRREEEHAERERADELRSGDYSDRRHRGSARRGRKRREQRRE
mmetsp:Transcript_16315/g.34601  ORF Transcript_16315/g.34601 Transcript_16315/m.34601 type:complete len:251 (-) Transcript_16315:798-1550(-)